MQTAAAIADRANYWFTPGGAGVLKSVKDCTPTNEQTLEGVIPEGFDEAVGSVSKPGNKYFELTLWPMTTPERDWRKLQRTREHCTFTRQMVGAGTVKGEKIQCRVQVAEVTEPTGTAGDYTFTVKLLVIGKINKIA